MLQNMNWQCKLSNMFSIQTTKFKQLTFVILSDIYMHVYIFELIHPSKSTEFRESFDWRKR